MSYMKAAAANPANTNKTGSVLNWRASNGQNNRTTSTSPANLLEGRIAGLPLISPAVRRAILNCRNQTISLKTPQ
jgi:hypothetical protein